MKIKNLYIISGAVVLAMITGYVIYRKAKNKKLIKRINEILDLEIGQSGTYHDKEEEFKDATEEGSEIPITADGEKKYKAMAINIMKAGYGFGTDEDEIYDTLNQLKSKEEFKKLSYIFLNTKYVYFWAKIELWDFLKEEFNDKEMEKATLIIARLK